MTKPLEIIYFLPNVDAGVASVTRNLLKYRPKTNHVYKVVFTSFKEGKSKNSILDNFNANEQIQFQYSKYDNLYAVFKRLAKHISSPDSVIVANDLLELRMHNALKLPNPLVYILHGDFGFYYNIAQLNQDVIDKVIGISKYNLESLKDKLKEKNKKKLKLIYFPVPEISFQEKNRNPKLQLLFVGSLINRKGVDLLRPIYDVLIEKNTKFELKIIGCGEEEATLKKQFKNIINVSFLGKLPQDKVLQHYIKSDALLLPTRSEGLPVVVVEAMKAGCVPVVSNIPSGIPDIIDDRINGRRVKVDDVNAFAEAILELIEQPGFLKKMSDNARAKANEMFDPYRQALIFEQEIVGTLAQKDKEFANYPLGRVLNKWYLPNFLVKTIRKIIKHPKI